MKFTNEPSLVKSDLAFLPFNCSAVQQLKNAAWKKFGEDHPVSFSPFEFIIIIACNPVSNYTLFINYIRTNLIRTLRLRSPEK